MRTKHVVFAAVVAIAAAGLAQNTSSSRPAASQSTRPAVKIIISKETTFLTGPLRPDGSVDYVKAWKEILSKDVTPDNNAMVLILKAVGPTALPEEGRAEMLAALGLKDLPDKGDYLIEAHEYALSHPSARPARLAAIEGAIPPLCDAVDNPTSRPWAEKDQPEAAAYLKANQKPLDLIVQASKLPKFYFPVIESDTANIMGDSWMPPLGVCRQLARILVRRAMMRFDGGDVTGAQDDRLAIHRLARLVGQRPSLIDELRAIAIDSLACSGDQAVATSGKLTEKQAMEYMVRLRELPPMAGMASALDIGERLPMLEYVQNFALGRPMTEDPGTSHTQSLPAVAARADWNQVLKRMNARFDLPVVYAKSPLSAEGKAARAKDEEMVKAAKNDPTLVEFAALFEKLRASGNALEQILDSLNAAIAKKTDQQITDLVVNYLFTNVPIIYRACDLSAEGQMRAELTPVALALAAYKADKGKYPAALADLVPAYIKELPEDIFTGKDLIYKLRGKGYIVYSVGVDQKDSGGEGPRGHTAEGPADDLAVKAEE